MFRLTERCASGGLVLKLEGHCSSEILGELEASWRAAVRRVGGRPIWIDLREVSRVDLAAQEQLARMHKDGARFVVRGCLMRELIREITN